MFKKLGIGLLAASFSICTINAYSTTNHMLNKGISVEYEFPPNDPQIFTNYLFWAVEATCLMSTEDESDELMAEAKAKKGTVNGIVLTAGENMRMQIHSGDTLKLRAESGAIVHITNFGKHTVKASCTT